MEGMNKKDQRVGRMSRHKRALERISERCTSTASKAFRQGGSCVRAACDKAYEFDSDRRAGPASMDIGANETMPCLQNVRPHFPPSNAEYLRQPASQPKQLHQCSNIHTPSLSSPSPSPSHHSSSPA